MGMKISILLGSLLVSTIMLQAQTPVLIDMVKVEGGSFTMGAIDGYQDEANVHKVTVSGFQIGRYEITQAIWEQVVGSNPSKFVGPNLPVETISWYDAIEFCNKLSERQGLAPYYTIEKTKQDPGNRNQSDEIRWIVTINPKANGYRLPTEAQWEYAARGGKLSKGFTFAGSNQIQEVAWTPDRDAKATQPVGQLKANELGLYDMSGNVFEWCFETRINYTTRALIDPAFTASGSNNIMRGGCYKYDKDYAKVASRYAGGKYIRFESIGLRVVLPL